ncbi:hypothetical protein BV20DRAFT_146791 [Pilatotrama ljubarskyi]|nr:hypothetical protein BV20DRAFT_146791 [Pilatotrama ljubarskyi]
MRHWELQIASIIAYRQESILSGQSHLPFEPSGSRASLLKHHSYSRSPVARMASTSNIEMNLYTPGAGVSSTPAVPQPRPSSLSGTSPTQRGQGGGMAQGWAEGHSEEPYCYSGSDAGGRPPVGTGLADAGRTRTLLPEAWTLL